MNWVKRGTATSIREVVEANTGLSEDELLNPKPVPPESIRSIPDALRIIRQALENKLPIYIIGDYDADGVTASAILYKMFCYLGVEPKVRLPRRFTEGYGLSMQAVREIEDGDGLVITVDNGITATEEIDALQSKGLTVVVLDHHLPGDRLR